jgi:co-chaperonin GroES (HSP10)
MTALIAALGIGGLIAWLNSGGSQLGRPIRIAPTRASTSRNSLEPSTFQVGDRVLHNEFGHGTVVATDGRRLTVEFDDRRMKSVVHDSFLIKSGDPRPAQ